MYWGATVRSQTCPTGKIPKLVAAGLACVPSKDHGQRAGLSSPIKTASRRSRVPKAVAKSGLTLEAVRVNAALAAAAAAPPEPLAEPPSAPDGVAPATIEVLKAPGKNGPMEVVVAAEVLRRVTRARQVVSLVSQVIIRSYEEEALHAEVCRHLVSFGGYLMAWIGLAEKDPEKVVRPVAHAGLENNFLSALNITWFNDLANTSPTSLAIQEQRPYVARNILQEPRYAVLREDAQLYGYTATCALPLQFAQYGMGVLTIHAMEPDAFNAEEVSLLRELANDLAAGVIGLRERSKRRALERRLVAVVDAAVDSIVGLDLDGRITDWNAGATRMYGYSRSEAVGKNLADLLKVPSRPEEAERIKQLVAKGEKVSRYETERKCKEGKVIPVAVTISPIFGVDGNVCGSTSIARDITLERIAEASKRTIELEELEVARLKGLESLRKTFISEASHELNTPLTPIWIHVEALGESKDLTPADREHVTVVERNTLRLRRLVTDMLEASRLETGRFALQLRDVALGPVIDEAIQGVSEFAATTGVMVTRAGQEVRVVTADRNRVGQVLFNFLTNAIGFTLKGGRVTVTVVAEGGQAVVRVEDTGIGMTADQIGKLFQPFARPHEGQGTGPKGTGLGLFTSKGIVEQHGGRIWAESPGPGQGSSFCFSLPLADTGPGKDPAPDAPSPQRSRVHLRTGPRERVPQPLLGVLERRKRAKSDNRRN